MQGWVLRSARPINPVILVLFTPNCIHIVIPKSKKQINVSNKLIIAMQYYLSPFILLHVILKTPLQLNVK